MGSVLVADGAVGRRGRRLRRPRRAERGGIAVVELALYLPLLLMLVMGSIDCCAMIYLDHSCCIAGYEGVRERPRRCWREPIAHGEDVSELGPAQVVDRRKIGCREADEVCVEAVANHAAFLHG